MSALGVDVCVIRHPEVDYYKELVESPLTSTVNGGDGSGQHPARVKRFDDYLSRVWRFLKASKVAIAGDLDHSRVAKSNMQILKRLGQSLYFCWSNNGFALRTISLSPLMKDDQADTTCSARAA